MLNSTEKKIIYLDKETLKYMYLTYTGEKVYPVMRKLYAVLSEGFARNWLVVPLELDHLQPYIENNKIKKEFLTMMGDFGQVLFHQRYNIKTMQLIRIISHYFENPSDKPLWRDAFTSDPDEKFKLGFNRYASITAQQSIQATSREKQYSQVFEFIESYRSRMPAEKMAALHFRSMWEQFQDIIKPVLPFVGAPETHMKRFLAQDDISDIPEFQIISSIFYPMVDAYGIDLVERGIKDEELFAAETAASCLPYCHYYVTKVDIAEVLNMSGVPETYDVRIYDHNESSLYRLIQNIMDDCKTVEATRDTKNQRTVFRRDGYRR